ncbi:growth hormone secretagogue receptor type 1-like [Austrofundulus limnaeus]|uniref:Growth hormone secretagogue receptor type 1-like n=1 Tax=Austrofundulus limnaeus TaxID=52670 RepID=A0A2I4CKZ6_AUSLI|nr:PREDICTED: growth hormone secretagogue receptor type 1-like [Austrofundulus limnaeus]
MATNVSLAFYQQQLTLQIFGVQILVTIFLWVNMFLIVTFFKKECFHSSARYILFAVMLLSDSFMLVMSDVLLVLNFFQFSVPVWLCIVISVVALVYAHVTPVTLTAMTLERYVAICLPLRHAELCSTRRVMLFILVIHGISFAPCVVVFSMFFTSASLSFYQQNMLCSVERFLFQTWQHQLRSAVSQIYFLIMCIIIVFCYERIVKVARAASLENKQSTLKGLRTVILHAFQLLLCLIQLWCPFIEAALFHVDLNIYMSVRYFNYIMFSLAPRCLSPLIYGLRDETFFLALKNYTCFSLSKGNNY